MTNYTVDPNRTVPDPLACYENPCTLVHQGWRHATSWDEVEEHLKAGALVNDRDGDQVTNYRRERNAVVLVNGGEYDYHVEQMLLEDIQIVPPATPEEEDDALASIMEAFKSNRLSP